MPAIYRLARGLNDSLCPPQQPSCIADAQDSALASQHGGLQSDDTPSYAGPVILLALVVISFILWLSWWKWPREKVKALWKMRKGRKKEDKGIRSSDFQRDNANSGESQHEYGHVKRVPEEVSPRNQRLRMSTLKSLQDMDIVDLEIDEKELGQMKVASVVGMK
jgi:hypothetical protein